MSELAWDVLLIIGIWALMAWAFGLMEDVTHGYTTDHQHSEIASHVARLAERAARQRAGKAPRVENTAPDATRSPAVGAVVSIRSRR